jgi:hypothetical protein
MNLAVKLMPNFVGSCAMPRLTDQVYLNPPPKNNKQPLKKHWKHWNYGIKHNFHGYLEGLGWFR